MSDVEQLVREALGRHGADAPTLDPSEIGSVTRRVRRRQVLNAVGAGLVALVMAVGAVSGIGALLSADAPKPAIEPTPTPSPLPGDFAEGPFEPPSQAPIVVGSGLTQGWSWMLSSSADGNCLALTDEQGSDVDCSGPSGDPIDVYVRMPGGSAPPIAFVFGRLPIEANVVWVDVPSRHRTVGKVFVIAPEALELRSHLFVGSIEGYDDPWVPDAIVSAVDTPAQTIIASGLVARPPSARAPFTVLAQVASGSNDFFQFGPPVQPPEPWEIDVFRDGRTGQVCLGEPGRESACGPADDPSAGWRSTWSSFELVDSWSGPMGLGHSPRFLWGVFRAPVASIQFEVLDPIEGLSGWHPADAEVALVPAAYGDAFTVFEVDCDCWGVRATTFDASGNPIETTRLN